MKYIGLFDEKEDIVTKEKLETKQDKITGAATTITDDNLTASHALVSDANGKVAVSPVTSTELGYLDGVTSSVQTQLNKKLETVHDNDILWGGNSLQNNVSPVDAAAITTIGGNKFALAKPTGITVEYSNDGGATWVDYGAADSLKVNVVSGLPNNGLYLGKKESSAAEAPTANDMLRVTIDAMACGGYTFLEKILIQLATNGVVGSAVKIESANIGALDTFTEVGTYPVAGNSGWNSIPLKVNFGGYVVSQTSNCGALRFTFSIESIGSSGSNRANVQNIVFLGITNWVTPSELAKTGHLYSYDYQQNATFPANVTATKFIGDGSNLTNIPYPVTSVNTKTGAVTLSASDVGAQPTITVNGIIKGDGAGNLSAQDTVTAELVDLPTVPTKVSELENDANYITADQAPVQSVNNKIGAVSLTASDVSAIPSTLTGTAGQVLTKTADGQEWKDVPVDENSVLLKNVNIELPMLSGSYDSSWVSAVYGAGKFVIVSNYSDPNKMITYSEDGVIWNVGASISYTGPLRSVTYGNGRFVAIGDGKLLYSSDAITWNLATFSLSSGFRVMYGGNKFIAFAGNNTNKAAYSTDGITWTAITLPASAYWNHAAYGNGKFIVAASFNAQYLYSDDGITWTQASLPESKYWKWAVFGSGKFVIASDSEYIYSTDGINWSDVTSFPMSPFENLIYADGRFFTYGPNGSYTISYSYDAITWTNENVNPKSYYDRIVYGANKFVAYHSMGKNMGAAISSDGINWVSSISSLQYPDGTDIHEQVKDALQIKELPTVTTADNGKFLRVVNGAWSADTIPNANGGSF